MIDDIVDSAFKGLKHIRLAEQFMLHQDVALIQIKKASYHLNRLKELDEPFYNRLIIVYDKVFTEYNELYHKPIGWTPKTLHEDD